MTNIIYSTYFSYKYNFNIRNNFQRQYKKMRARCVLYVYRRPADTLWPRRTALQLRLKPEDNTNTTLSSALNPQDVQAQIIQRRRPLALVPRRMVVPEVTILRIPLPQAVACLEAPPLTVTTLIVSNQLTGWWTSKHTLCLKLLLQVPTFKHRMPTYIKY